MGEHGPQAHPLNFPYLYLKDERGPQGEPQGKFRGKIQGGLTCLWLTPWLAYSSPSQLPLVHKKSKGIKMSRDNVLTQAECFAALRNGFILQNEHGFTVKLKNGKQFITNKRRLRKRGKAYPYQFDYPTWQPIGRINWWERLKNKIMM